MGQISRPIAAAASPCNASRRTKRARLVAEPISPTPARSSRASAAATMEKSIWWSCVITSTSVPAGNVRHLRGRVGGKDRRDVARTARGNASGARIDPGDAQRQIPQQSHQCTPHMPGPEQRDVQPRGTHRFEQHADMPAAALAERGTQRKIAHHREPLPPSSMSRAASMQANSRLPPPIVPNRASRVTTILQPASRGVDPRAESTVTSTDASPARSSSASASSQVCITRPPWRWEPSATVRRRATASKTASGVAGASRCNGPSPVAAIASLIA